MKWMIANKRHHCILLILFDYLCSLTAMSLQKWRLVWYWEYKVIHINHKHHYHHHQKWNEWLPTKGIIAYYCYYWKSSEQLFCCSNRCVQNMWSGIDSCTHLCACQCTLCDRGQQEDRFIPVQLRTITHCLRAFHPEVITSDSNNNNSNKTTKKSERKRSHKEM